MNTNKICLGTAKIGDRSYGFPKKYKKNDIEKFLEKAYDFGIRNIDTSPRYGEAEKIIGKSLNGKNQDFKISSKIDNLTPNDKFSKVKMLESVSRSLDKLCITSLEICYLHQNCLNIISDRYVIEGLYELKDKGMVENVGTSIYSKEELEFTVDSGLFDWIQVPANILDTSFYKAVIDRSKAIKLAARSIFLQGLLYDRKAIDLKINDSSFLQEILEQIQGLAEKYGLTFEKLLVSYINSLAGVQQILVGTLSINHLENIISDCCLLEDTSLINDLNHLSVTEKPWTNPRKWNT